MIILTVSLHSTSDMSFKMKLQAENYHLTIRKVFYTYEAVLFFSPFLEGLLKDQLQSIHFLTREFDCSTLKSDIKGNQYLMFINAPGTSGL